MKIQWLNEARTKAVVCVGVWWWRQYSTVLMQPNRYGNKWIHLIEDEPCNYGVECPYELNRILNENRIWNKTSKIPPAKAKIKAT